MDHMHEQQLWWSVRLTWTCLSCPGNCSPYRGRTRNDGLMSSRSVACSRWTESRSCLSFFPVGERDGHSIPHFPLVPRSSANSYPALGGSAARASCDVCLVSPCCLPGAFGLEIVNWSFPRAASWWGSPGWRCADVGCWENLVLLCVALCWENWHWLIHCVALHWGNQGSWRDEASLGSSPLYCEGKCWTVRPPAYICRHGSIVGRVRHYTSRYSIVSATLTILQLP